MTRHRCKHVTVGYETNRASAAAVFWAAAHADLIDAELRIVPCSESAAGEEGYFVGHDIEALVEGDISPLASMRGLVRDAHPGVLVTTASRCEPARVALTGHGPPPDVLVIGAQRRESPVRIWSAPTSHWLTRHSECPVVVVPAECDAGLPGRVIVGFDGSDASMRAVEWAADEADLVGCELVVIHAWSTPYRAVDPSSAQGRDLARVDAARILDQGVEAARERCGRGPITPLLIESGPATALLENAHRDDLIVVGASGHGAVATTLLGSTVNRVVDAAAAPVAVVRHGQGRTA